LSEAFYPLLRVLIWGAQAASLLFLDHWSKSFCENRSLKSTFCRRQAASDCRLAACAPQNLTRGETTQENARWQTSGRAILNVVCR